MNERETKYWALRKWRRARDNKTLVGIGEYIPELEHFQAECSYCEVYREGCYSCAGCPVVVGGASCYSLAHPFNIPSDQENFFPLMIDLIKSIEVPPSTEEQFFRE